MKTRDALNILNLNGDVTQEEIKKAYRKACSTYHPDRNPAGADMMKLVNAAYEALADFKPEDLNDDSEYTDFGAELNAALNAIYDCDGLEVEICGSWIWVGGNTKAHKDILKEAGFKWASKKKLWNFRPADWKSRSRGNMSMDDIRATHGSASYRRAARKSLAAA